MIYLTNNFFFLQWVFISSNVESYFKVFLALRIYKNIVSEEYTNLPFGLYDRCVCNQVKHDPKFNK